MRKLHKHIAELAMIQAIPLTATASIPKGRVRGLLERLQKQSKKQLNALPDIPEHEYAEICERVVQWGELTWGTKKVHAVTMCSFALGLIENSALFTHRG